MRPIEKRIATAEAPRDEARQANARSLRAHAHLSRPELEALLQARVVDFYPVAPWLAPETCAATARPLCRLSISSNGRTPMRTLERRLEAVEAKHTPRTSANP